MDRLELAISLIREAKAEEKRLVDMLTEIDKIPANDPFRQKKVDAIRGRYRVIPSDKTANDYLKTAIQLLEREVI